MADLKKQLADINKEINEIRKSLGDKPLKPFNINELEEAKLALKGLRAEARELGSDLDYISKSFKDSVNELSRQNTYLTDAKNSIKGISDISRKITDFRRGETTLSEKQLKNLKDQARVKFESLKNDIKSGSLSKENAKEAQNALDQQDTFNTEVDRTIKLNKEVNKEIGLVGTGIKGISGALSKMGFGDLSQPLQDAIDKTKNARLQQKLNNDELKKVREEYDKTSPYDLLKKKALRDQMASLKGQNKELSSQTSKYKNIGKALQDQLTKYNAVDAIIGGLVKGFMESQKGIGDLAKGLGISATRATQMRQDFADIANSSLNSNINVKDLAKTQQEVSKAIGSSAKLNKEDLETMTELVKQTGLQHGELMGIQKLSLATGKSLDDNVKAALGGATAYAMQNKMVIDNNKVLREINNASDALKLSLGGSVEALGEAVVKVQQLGMDLKTAESIANSMLNFESSIEAELQAELLTGKDLNLERARQLALEGKVAEAAAEVADQLGNAEEFGKMNVIQQEALAKSVGLSREQLAKTLIERQALEAMNAEEGTTLQENYEKLVKAGKTREEIQKMVGEEALAQMEQQSAQDKFNASVEKLKEIFTQVMDALAPIFDLLSLIAEVIMPAINYVLSPIIDTFRGISDIITAIVDPTKSLGETLADMGPVTAGIAVALAAAGVAVMGSLVPGLIRAGIAAAAQLPALISGAIAAVTSASAMTLGIGAIAIAAGIAGVVASMASAKTQVQDAAFSSSDGFVLQDKKGKLFEGDPDDDVIMAPGISELASKGSKNKKQEGLTKTSSPTIDFSPLLASLEKIHTLLELPQILTLDNNKFGETTKEKTTKVP